LLLVTTSLDVTDSIAEFCLLQKFYLLSKVWILTFECMMRIITKRTMLYFDDDLVTRNWVMRYIGQSCNAGGLLKHCGNDVFQSLQKMLLFPKIIRILRPKLRDYRGYV
jgi:hypothetical protein